MSSHKVFATQASYTFLRDTSRASGASATQNT